ncbi:MAG: hypothetical protein M3367_03310 [Acidobacteriota bacterium]|nr:hypothetical protein [Acidobacteriota bacterium]
MTENYNEKLYQDIYEIGRLHGIEEGKNQASFERDMAQATKVLAEADAVHESFLLTMKEMGYEITGEKR